MEEEKCGVLTPLEVCRMIEYLHSVGLTEEQIYEFWAFVATGHRIPAPHVKGK